MHTEQIKFIDLKALLVYTDMDLTQSIKIARKVLSYDISLSLRSGFLYCWLLLEMVKRSKSTEY